MKEYLYRLATDQQKGFVARLLKAILWIFSLLYWVVIALRVLLYRIGILPIHRLEQPVVCVGNITMGGVGKTPLVETIVKYLKEQNLKPAILTRGYMSEGQQGQVLSDEVQMLTKKLRDVPILVGSDRYQVAKAFTQENEVDIFVMDDGFQHRKLYRDQNIVAIDATNPFGNRHLIPRGILRECPSALKRADMIVITKSDLAQENVVKIKDTLKNLGIEDDVYETVYHLIDFEDLRTTKRVAIDTYKGISVCALSSIGNAKAFHQSIKNLGCNISHEIAFMDHHVYSQDDIRTINDIIKKHKPMAILTTQKDAAKLTTLLPEFDAQCSILALNIEVAFKSGKDDFFKRIHSLLRR